MVGPGVVCRARNHRGPRWNHRRPERVRPGHHVYGDVAPDNRGVKAPRFKRRQRLPPGLVPTLLSGCRGRRPSAASACAREKEYHRPGPEPGMRLAFSSRKYTLCGGQTMRYEVTTTLSPQAAITYAKNYFGPQ